MPKKISDRQRLITYAMSASREQLDDALDTIKAILLSRFPKEPKIRTPRTRKSKPATDATQPTLPADGMDEIASGASN